MAAVDDLSYWSGVMVRIQEEARGYSALIESSRSELFRINDELAQLDLQRSQLEADRENVKAELEGFEAELEGFREEYRAAKAARDDAEREMLAERDCN